MKITFDKLYFPKIFNDLHETTKYSPTVLQSTLERISTYIHCWHFWLESFNVFVVVLLLFRFTILQHLLTNGEARMTNNIICWRCPHLMCLLKCRAEGCPWSCCLAVVCPSAARRRTLDVYPHFSLIFLLLNKNRQK